eukprot:Nk52_evm36s252 gene=Nk52_evmTU36s252
MVRKSNKALQSSAAIWLVVFALCGIASVQGASESCKADSDCSKYNYCKFEEGQGLCHHDALIPVQTMDWVTAAVSFVGACMAVVGGIGGGGLFVPLLMLLLNFDATAAVPLSKAMIFGAAIVAIIFVYKTKIVDNGSGLRRPAIDLNACILLQPLCLAGTVIGVFLNVLLPSWIIVILLCLVLGFSTYKTFQKAFKQGKKDRRMSKMGVIGGYDSRVPCDATQSSELHRLSGDIDYSNEIGDIAHPVSANPKFDPITEEAEYFPGMSADQETSRAEKKKQIAYDYIPKETREAYEALVKSETKFSVWRIAVLVFMWLVIFGTALVKKMVGGCGATFWSMSFVPLAVAIILTMYCGRIVRKEYKLKIACAHEFADTDFIWNEKHTMIFPIFALVAGIAAGMVGIGGGMVMGPLLLTMSKESDPVVTTAISSVLVLFTSSSTTIQFLLLGVLQLDFALFFTGFTVIAAVIGKVVVSPYITAKNKKSWILYCLGLVIGVSCILTTYQGIVKIVDQIEHGSNYKFSIDSVCEAT